MTSSVLTVYSEVPGVPAKKPVSIRRFRPRLGLGYQDQLYASLEGLKRRIATTLIENCRVRSRLRIAAARSLNRLASLVKISFLLFIGQPRSVFCGIFMCKDGPSKSMTKD